MSVLQDRHVSFYGRKRFFIRKIINVRVKIQDRFAIRKKNKD